MPVLIWSKNVGVGSKLFIQYTILLWETLVQFHDWGIFRLEIIVKISNFAKHFRTKSRVLGSCTRRPASAVGIFISKMEIVGIDSEANAVGIASSNFYNNERASKGLQSNTIRAGDNTLSQIHQNGTFTKMYSYCVKFCWDEDCENQCENCKWGVFPWGYQILDQTTSTRCDVELSATDGRSRIGSNTQNKNHNEISVCLCNATGRER